MSNKTAPRTPNHNQICTHCHLPVRDYPKMSKEAVKQSDDIWRRRLGCLKFVDDVIGILFKQLHSMKELENTLYVPTLLLPCYAPRRLLPCRLILTCVCRSFLYTADNGFHLGQWAMGFDKRQLYETDVRVPYVVQCPGCT